MVKKQDIRKNVLKQRNLMTEKEWDEHSHEIYKKVVTHPFFLEADEIYCYIDFRNEVDTRKIIEEAWRLGKRVAAPRIEGSEMNFYYIDSFTKLESGYFGVLEPVGEEKAEGEQVLVIMPGAAFDKKRNRIGYGKGYYDRFLEKYPTYRTLALAFELQVVDKIPSDSFDVKPNQIVTEENIYD